MKTFWKKKEEKDMIADLYEGAAEADEEVEPVANITGNKRNRKQCRSKGGVSYNKPRASNLGSGVLAICVVVSRSIQRLKHTQL
jgi:hypothetical protein